MRNDLPQKLQQLYYSDKLLWIIICVGILLRVIRYIHNPSLWFDEAAVASDIINRPLPELINPSPYIEQTSPLGFVILTKIIVLMLGNSEYALRLYPLAAGIISLFLFYKVAKRYIQPKAVPVALGLFAISDILVYYSAELKTYSPDVTISLLLFFTLDSFLSKKMTTLRVILAGLVGAVAVWFSHPSVFVLAGIGITLIIVEVTKKEWKRAGCLLLAGFLWIVSFIANYFLYARPLMSSFGNTVKVLEKSNAIMPFPPTSLKDVEWYLNIFFTIIRDASGLTLTGIAALCFLTGCLAMLSKRKETLSFLLLPMFITFVASSFHLYAIQGRLLLFLVPSMILLIAEGIEYISSRAAPHNVATTIFITGLLVLHPLTISAYHTIRPESREEIKPVMRYIKDNWQSGDALYVYYMSLDAFDYYNNHHPGNYGFHDKDVIMGRGPRDWYATYRKKEFKGFWNENKPFGQPYLETFKEYTEDLNKLKGREKGLDAIFIHGPERGLNEEKFFVYYFATIGKQIDFYGRPEVSAAYLYDLSSK